MEYPEGVIYFGALAANFLKGSILKKTASYLYLRSSAMLKWALIPLVLFATWAYAEEEDPAVLSRPIYVPVKPAFVVNYGEPGRLKYLKLEISLRVKDTPASNSVRHHMPLIRDFLVREFSNLTDEDVDTQTGKESVRVSALEGLQALILEEDGEQGITDLFFNTFVVQR